VPDPRPNSSLTLSDLTHSVRTHWRSFLIVVVVALAIGIASGILVPDEYAASASLTVEPVDVTGTATSVNMDTERVVAASTSVVLAAVADVPALTAAELKSDLAVSVPKGSQVLEFTVTHADPQVASEAANAVATAYNAQRITLAKKGVADSVTTLTDRVTALESTKAVEGENSQAGKAASVQIEALEANIATLNAATFTEGNLVSPAVTPRSSTKPSLAIFGAGALVFGVLVGGFVALGRARRDEVRLASLGESRSPHKHKNHEKTARTPEPEIPALDSTATSPAKPRKRPVAPRPARVAPASRSGEVT
jgi:uncharacterized protein involved in exopolysaccharide biosynthesis